MSFAVSGYRLTTNDLFEVERELAIVFDRVRARSKELLMEYLIRETVNKIDLHAVKGRDLPSDLLSFAWIAYSDACYTAESKPYSSHHDHGLSVSIIPFNNRLYAIPLSYHSELRGYFAESKIAENFFYWDSTDPDGNISKSDWAEREHIWSAIFETCWKFSEVGFVRTVRPWNVAPTRQEVCEAIPGLDSRSRRATRQQIIDEFCEREDHKGEVITEVANAMLDAQQFLESDEGKRALELRVLENALKLPIITPEML